MKSNNRLILFFLCFFSSFVVLAFLLFFLFLAQNNLSWSEYWQRTEIYGSIPIPKLKITKGIKTLHQELTFPTADIINITVDIEKVSFVEEEREDILVVYDYRHPHSPEYDIDFKAFLSEDLLQIIATTQSSQKKALPIESINPDSIYRGSVTIHVPKGFRFQTLSLTTSLLDIRSDMLYENCDSYILSSLMGNIDLALYAPKNLVSIDADLGNVSVRAKAPIQTFDLFSNLGNSFLNFEKELDTLYVLNDFGSCTVLLEKKLTAATVQSNVGDIRLFFGSLPDALNVYTLTGNLFGYIAENLISTAATEQGTIRSYFRLDQTENPSYYFMSSTGDITLLPPKKEVLSALKEEYDFAAEKSQSDDSTEKSTTATGSSILVK